MKRFALMVVALGLVLLASAPAKACSLFRQSYATPVVVAPIVQTFAVQPVLTPAIVTPTVGSVAVLSEVVVPVVTPVFPVFAFDVFHGYNYGHHGQNVIVVGHGHGHPAPQPAAQKAPVKGGKRGR